MPLDILGPFLLTSIIITLMPGPDNLFVLSLSAIQGSKAGLLTATGMAIGNFVHIFAVGLGLSALLMQTPSILMFIKVFGIAYLLYLAWQNWRYPMVFSDRRAGATGLKQTSAFALFKRGVLMNMLNPKIALFFIAFFPQFVDQNSPHQSIQLFLLGTIFVLQTMFIFGLIALLAGKIHFLITHLPPKIVAGSTSGIYLCLCVYLLSTDLSAHSI